MTRLNNRRMVLVRLQDCGTQKLGLMYVYGGTEEVFRCCTLELPWRGNQRNISAIPPGRYRVTKRWSPRFGHHFHVQDVHSRTFILMHVGNYYTQTEGCILVGSEFRDINNDGHNDVTNSRATLNALLALMPDSFTLDVISTDGR